MFNPYGFQGGTATLDPQASGMNGQTRIAEAINGFVPNVSGTTPFPGIPVGQPAYIPSSFPNVGVPGYGQPNFVNAPFGVNTTPFNNFAHPQTNYGIPQNVGTPGFQPFAQPFPCPTTPYGYGMPISYGAPVNYPTPFGYPTPATTPYINNIPIHPWVQSGIGGQWPVPFTGFNPFAAINPYATINPFTGFPVTTPFGGISPVNPYVQNGINPFGGIPSIHPITGQPMVSHPFSAIAGGCNTPVSIPGNPMAQTPYGINPMACSPFVNPQFGIRNVWGQPTVNPWFNPSIPGFNPMFQGFTHPFFSSPVTPTGIPNPLVANPLAVNPLGVQPVVPGLQGIAPVGNPLHGNPLAWGGQFGSLPFGAGIDPVTYNYLCNLAACCSIPSLCGSPLGFGGTTTPWIRDGIYSSAYNISPILAGRTGFGVNPWNTIPTPNPFAMNTINPFVGSINPWFGGIQNPWIGGINNPWSVVSQPWNNPVTSHWNNPIASQWNSSFVNPSYMGSLSGICGSNGSTIPGVTPFNGTPGIGSFTSPSVFSNLTSCWPTNCN